MISAEEILQYLKSNKALLQEKYYLTEIGLFGSFARNEQTELSDIDLLVQYKEGTPDLYSVEIQLKELLKSHFNRDVDICSKKWIKPVFKPLVLKDVIYA